MSKNLIPKIARMFGVEQSENFKVVTKGGSEYICKFDLLMGLIVDDGLSEYYDKELLVEIILGDAEIIKLPWKPKKGETYYTFEILRGKWIVHLLWWAGSPNGYALLDKGWVFRTKEEAEAALPAVAREIGVEYEL